MIFFKHDIIGFLREMELPYCSSWHFLVTCCGGCLLVFKKNGTIAMNLSIFLGRNESSTTYANINNTQLMVHTFG